MLQSDPVFAIIARTEPFSELSGPHTHSLAGLCRMRRYGKGEVIFQAVRFGVAFPPSSEPNFDAPRAPLPEEVWAPTPRHLDPEAWFNDRSCGAEDAEIVGSSF